MSIAPQPTGVPSGIGFSASPPIGPAFAPGAQLLATYSHNSVHGNAPYNVARYDALLVVYTLSINPSPANGQIIVSWDTGVVRTATFNRTGVSRPLGILWQTLPIEGKTVDVTNPAAIGETVALYGLVSPLAEYGIADDNPDGILLRAGTATAAIGSFHDFGESLLYQGQATVSASVGVNGGSVNGYGIDDLGNPLFMFPLIAQGDGGYSALVQLDLPPVSIDWQVKVNSGGAGNTTAHIAVTACPRA